MASAVQSNEMIWACNSLKYLVMNAILKFEQQISPPYIKYCEKNCSRSILKQKFLNMSEWFSSPGAIFPLYGKMVNVTVRRIDFKYVVSKVANKESMALKEEKDFDAHA